MPTTGPKTVMQMTSLKTGKSKRDIPMPGFVRDALLEHREQQKVLSPMGLVFIQPDGRPIEARRLYDLFQQVLKRAGLEHCRFHSLRHSAATFLLAEGADVATVGSILGHSRAAMTMPYAHALEQSKVAAVNRLDNLFRRTGAVRGR